MMKIKDALKSLTASKKNLALAVFSVVAVIFLLASELSGEVQKEKGEANISAGISAEEYIEEQEKRLALLLEKIDGAGEVEVMITLETCYENVYLKDSSLKTESTKGVFKEEVEDNFIITKNGSDAQNGVLIKVYQPVIKGVAVVATGGDNESVKMAIIETVSAVFNINSTNISVEKMEPERKKQQ